ncbi:MAG: hypothetical protein ACR5LG_01690 [Sodalis sp. (in: enterobacteria)]|uniref:hypothetical protein n=1 Tax=Sodalis sp. (in: enterobacteria) TaxID=1898979 RepID=UPI003F37C483
MCAPTAPIKDVILIEADPGYTAKVLLQALCARLGLLKTGNIHELVEECVQGATLQKLAGPG